MNAKKKAAPVLAHRYGSRAEAQTKNIIPALLRSVKHAVSGLIIVALPMWCILIWCGFAEGNVAFLGAVANTLWTGFSLWVMTKWAPEYFDSDLLTEEYYG